ncbi:MAG: hypothetical protein P8M22_01655 [Phycisphaerales bacterium]|nr:hypothetical protein [Phycisphaerales bacterium]
MESTHVDILIGSDGPERLEGRAIRLPLPCKQCRYDLQGLPALAACPECGLPASRSLEAIIDPTTHRLPPLLAPKVVGNALLSLAILSLLACVAMIVMILAHLPWITGGLSRAAYWFDSAGILISLICGLIAVWPAIMLWPSPEGTKGFDGRQGIGVCLVGLIIWITGCVLIWWFPPSAVFGPGPIFLVSMAGGVIFLSGLRLIVVVVGRRSRVFRTDQIRRQRIRDLVVGLGFVALGITLSWLGELAVTWKMSSFLTLGRFTISGNSISGLAFIGMAMALVAGLLVLVGFIYLSFNMSWVRQALKSPPPRLREYLD